MPIDVTNKVDKLIYSFLWKNKERVKRKVIINSIKDGGLNMLDTKFFFSGLKAKWISRIVNNPDNIIGNAIINNFGPDKLLLKITEIQSSYLNQIPPFYKQVLECYININSLQNDCPTTVTDLLHQPLWCNKHITSKRNGKKHVMYLSNWIKNGIIYVKDLNFIGSRLDERYILNNIKDKRNIIIEIAELRESLKPYSELLQQVTPHHRPITHNRTLTLLKWTSKQLYTYQIQHFAIPPQYTKLKEACSTATDYDMCDAIQFKIIKEHDKRLATFNFKIFHNILICGDYLSKWDGKTNSICQMCRKVDNIKHMLYECHAPLKIWQIASKALQRPISLHNVLIYTDELTYESTLSMNSCFTNIAYGIYKFWIETLNNGKLFSERNLHYYMVGELGFRINVLTTLNKNSPTLKLLKTVKTELEKALKK